MHINVTRFRDEMRVEFGKMKKGLQEISKETARRGFNSAVDNSPILTGYLHHNWGVAVGLGDAHKTLPSRTVRREGGRVVQSYERASQPNLSGVKWNSTVELYNDTWYAEKANKTSSRPGFYEMSISVMKSYLASQQTTDWMKTHASPSF